MDEPKQCDAPVRGLWSTSAQVDVEAARKTLYHSDGTGVLKVSSFLDPRATETLRQRWLSMSTEHWAEGLGNHEAGPGAPRYRIQGPHDQDAWCLGPWNTPPDSLTFSAVFTLQKIRNAIEGRPSWRGLMDFQSSWIQIRVVHTRSGPHFVGAHADYAERPPATPLGSHHRDLGRLQATLLLSTPGVDWAGEGFWLKTLDGSRWTLAESNAKAGDLLLWRHSLEHGVGSVQPTQGGAGLLRILVPVVVPVTS